MIREAWQRARGLLLGRRAAYQRTFAGTAGSEPDIVLRDLATFCRAHESTHHPDARVAARLDGRREVFLRIQHHLRMTPEQLWDLYDGRSPTDS